MCGSLASQKREIILSSYFGGVQISSKSTPCLNVLELLESLGAKTNAKNVVPASQEPRRRIAFWEANPPECCKGPANPDVLSQWFVSVFTHWHLRSLAGAKGLREEDRWQHWTNCRAFDNKHVENLKQRMRNRKTSFNSGLSCKRSGVLG